MTLTDNAVALAKEMLKEDGSDSLLFYTKKVEGGLTLAIGALKATDKDRVLIINGMQVVMDEHVEHMLARIEIDAEDGNFVINAECSDPDCDCGGHHHHDEEDDCDCGCGHHHDDEDDYDDDCDCGCGHHHDDGEDDDCECGCGHHHED